MKPSYTVLAKNLKCEIRKYEDDHMDFVVFAPENIHITLPGLYYHTVAHWIHTTHQIPETWSKE